MKKLIKKLLSYNNRMELVIFSSLLIITYAVVILIVKEILFF